MSQIMLDRRAFMRNATAIAAGAATMPAVLADHHKKLFDISLAQWSLNRHYFKRVEPHMDARNFAKWASEHDIHAVEYVNQFYMDHGEDEAFFQDLDKRAKDHGVKSLLIMVDREGRLGDPDKNRRLKAVENHFKWLQAAKILGCHSIRVNAATDARLPYHEQMRHAADGLRRLSEFGEVYGLNVIVENHGGLSSHGRWLASVMEMVDHPRCGTLPDFGNFGIIRDRRNPANSIWYDRYLGVHELMPYAKAVSAKSHKFDDAGNEVDTDFFKIMKIVLDHGYRGYVGIEFEGGDVSQPEGIMLTKKLLERVRERYADQYKAA